MADDSLHTSRVSGSKSSQNPSPTENQVQPEVSMESVVTPKKTGAKAYDGGPVTTESA